METVDDTTDEPDSTVTARVDGGTGYTIGSPNSAVLTVADNDSASTPTPTLPPPTEDLPHVTITAGPSPVTEGHDRDVHGKSQSGARGECGRCA